MKKVIAALICPAMALSAFSFHAEAMAQFTDSIEIDGYEYFDDHGVFEKLGYSETGQQGYLTYWGKADENSAAMIILTDPLYNITSINISNASENLSKWEEIYSKYEDRLDYDKVSEVSYADRVSISMYDFGDELNSFDSTAVSDKSELVAEMCTELYNAGAVTSASFSRYKMSLSDAAISNWHYIEANIGAGDYYEEIADAVKSIDGNLTVSIFENEDGSGKCIGIEGVKTHLDFVEIGAAIKNVYPDTYIGGSISASSSLESQTYQSEQVDILEEFKQSADIPYGDLNSDGKIGILDAIYISKANAQIITLNESQTKAADLNSDGTVDDADLNILLSYLVEQIDTLPIA